MTAERTISSRAQRGSPSNGGATRTDAYCTSGSSPTLHILGAGPVGRALLDVVAPSALRTIAVSDSSGTVAAPRGHEVDRAAIRDAKRQGHGVSSLPGGDRVAARLAAKLFAPDLVADCTSSTPAGGTASVERSFAILDGGACLATAAKDAFLAAPLEFLDCRERWSRFGFNAVLGGTGLALKRELFGLRPALRSVRCVPNATTTAILEGLERGSTFAAAQRRAVDRGLCERDASSDIRGEDAAWKLAIVASIVSGAPRTLDEIELPESLDELDADRLVWRHERGITTRLVGRVHAGGELTLRYEALPRASTLAVPSNRVVYGYELERGALRVHFGAGLGPEGTARAVLDDLVALVRPEVRR